METKVCSKCKQERRINLFKADRARNPEYMSTYMKDYYQLHKI